MLYLTFNGIIRSSWTIWILKHFFIPVKIVCRSVFLAVHNFRVRNGQKRSFHHLIVQDLSFITSNGFTKIDKIKQVQTWLWPPMNLGKLQTFFYNFYVVRQNKCQFRLDANIENITTYFSPITVLTQNFVKFWLIIWYEFLDWSCGVPQVSYVDVK